MRLDASIRRRLWLHHLLFLALFGLAIGLLAWLSLRYSMQADWSDGQRNTLSVASQTLLAGMDGPIRVTAYARDNPALRDAIRRLAGRYQRHKPDLSLAFINPDLLPDRVRELGITLDGELYVEYRSHGERIQRLGEQAMTHALQRLSRGRERRVRFLVGHGERKPDGIANHDLGSFGRELEKIGIQPHALDLAKAPQIPAGTAALVIAGPQTLLPPADIQVVLNYVEQGGNLLWLLEPKDPSGLQPLATALGVTALPGVVIDPDAPRLGLSQPDFIPIADYGPHPITALLRSTALLPQTVALEIQPPTDWKAALLLESQSRSWTETGALDDSIQFDPNTTERSGLLTVGVALSRARPETEQRIVVIGDGDFLSNTYLGNGANLELGLNILNWLTLDDTLIAIPPRTAPDPTLNLSDRALALMAGLFLIGLPVIFLISGGLIGFYRRRR